MQNNEYKQTNRILEKRGINDIDTAELLINNNKLLHGLFFCHLVLEKIIKAHVVLTTKNIPPKSHDLLYLLKKNRINIRKQGHGISRINDEISIRRQVSGVLSNATFQ